MSSKSLLASLPPSPYLSPRSASPPTTISPPPSSSSLDLPTRRTGCHIAREDLSSYKPVSSNLFISSPSSPSSSLRSSYEHSLPLSHSEQSGPYMDYKWRDSASFTDSYSFSKTASSTSSTEPLYISSHSTSTPLLNSSSFRATPSTTSYSRTIRETNNTTTSFPKTAQGSPRQEPNSFWREAQKADSSEAACPNWQTTVATPCERSTVGVVVQRSSQRLALLPVSWDIAVSIYRELARLVHRLPFHKRLVVCLVYRGHKFRLDLGEVKAAGVACLIGLGLSLGTLLLYRLYFRIIVPFLNSVWTAKGKHSLLDDEYTLHLEDSDSDVDARMGNNSSKRPAVPSVYYSRGYGVSVGCARPPTLCTEDHIEGGGEEEEVAEEEESTTSTTGSGVRLRPRKAVGSIHRKSPSPASDKDSAIGGTEMSQSVHSELSSMRDSFYSSCTAESGFDDLGFLEELRGRELRLGGSPGGSMRENFSPSSLRERNLQMLYRAHHGVHSGDVGLNSLSRSAKPGLDTLSDCSSEHSGVVSSCSLRSSCDGQSTGFSTTLTNKDPLVHKLAGRTSRQSHSSHDRSSIANGRLSSNSADAHLVSSESSPCHTTSQNSQILNGRCVPPPYLNQQHSSQFVHPTPSECEDIMDASESIRSFNSSACEDIDWNLEDCEDRDMLSTDAPPPFHQSLTDIQFKQSLMQRIQEWSSFAEEYNKSRSPTPHASPMRFVRRSRSLDRHLGDPGSILMAGEAEIAASRQLVNLEPTTERNLETLEYELHDIQGEFESITSKLHELIEQGTADATATTTPSSHRVTSGTTNAVSSTSKSSSPHHQIHQTPPFTPLTSSHNQHSSSSHHHINHHNHHRHHHGNKHHNASGSSAEAARLRRLRTRWERVPSSACSTSSRGSRASSMEFAWDLADYTQNSGADSLHASPARVIGEQVSEVINICTPVSLANHSEQEWKGDTDKARTIRQGYSKIPSLLSCHRMAVVRGDNYCGLRSVLFQVLSSGLRVTRGWSGIIGVMDGLHSLYGDGRSGLDGWTFANRLPGHCADRLASMSKCMLTLYATIEEVCNLSTQEEREKRTISLLNTSATFDLELMEGLKVMMLLTLSDLHRKIEDGAEEVPIFSHLLFARDSSTTVSDFLHNHLNMVGDSGGLEQVEMCLLGYALGVKIRVLRLSQLGQQDFDCFFPEDVPSDWPTVSLIAEDDRHYNVPLP